VCGGWRHRRVAEQREEQRPEEQQREHQVEGDQEADVQQGEEVQHDGERVEHDEWQRGGDGEEGRAARRERQRLDE